MSYNKHTWVNNVDAVDENKMNNIENGIANAVEKTGDTMTGPLILRKTSYNYNGGTIPGTKGAAAHTIEDLINELRYTNGQIGSVEIKTAYTLNNVTIAVGWYNYAYIPHRKGGLDGGADGDSANFGTLMLTGMNVSSPVYVLRYNNQNIAELKRLAEQSTGWTNATKTSKLKSSGAIRYNKIGNVVIVNFADIEVNSSIASHGDILATGLPKSIIYLVSALFNYSGSKPMRIAITTDGKIQTHYSNEFTASDSTGFYGTIVYVTN